MPSIVALDIETTGLDPRNDVIIEIGAVRFSGSRIEGEWTTLVNPGRPIPSFITQLTGITNEMVRNAPPIKAMIQELADFVGSDPVLGHNVRFDLSFLQQHQILKDNPVIDTYELASVLMPTASRYNLGALGQRMNVLLPATHRALDDARVTHAIFVHLHEMGMELPTGTIAEFVRLSETFEWGARWIFNQILRNRMRQPVIPRQADRRPVFHSPDVFLPPLSPQVPASALDEDEVCAMLEYGGPFAHYFPQYEYRPQQVEMLRAVTRALSKSHHLLVEAGTGTGKSFAYLIPAALWAVQNSARVVISTNTINLQDQLTRKDIPDLCQALGIDLRVAVLKGRANYLCPRRLESLRQRGPDTVDEMRVLAKIMVWRMETDSGDRGEINLNGPVERDIWMRLSAEDEGCKAETCQTRISGACPFYRARQVAQSAHILVVNHALLLSDVATGNRVLPEYDHLIIDEGHHIEAATTDALSFRVTQGDVIRLLRELGGASSGVLGYLLNLMEDFLRPAELAGFNQIIHRATDLLFRLEHYFREFFTVIEDFLTEQREGRPISGYGQQERIVQATRTLPDWTNVEIIWDEVHETAGLLHKLLEEIYKTSSELAHSKEARAQESVQDLDDALDSLGDAYRRLLEADGYLHSMVASPGPNYIYWIEIQPGNNTMALNIAPLHIGPLMEKYLWQQKSTVILTSATLTTHEGFEYIRGRLNAHEAQEMQLGSPFDYESAALLYLVNDIPEPSDTNGHQRAVDQVLIRLSKATNGRMLALFTSYAQLRRTSTNISPALAEEGIIVYEQGEGASPNTLLETFREADKAVLLGTRSFWEGVDIPGQALSVLVIVKLPFDVPSEPIVAARSETFDDPFNEFQLPEAILRFRQGFGRLIRTQSDRGVVAILDRRILTKRYGRAFLESLPTCKVQSGTMRDLPANAARWLDT